jgi:alpha,alpha-trehalase
MASVGFIPPDDPRFASTLRAIQSELTAGSYPLLYRYKADDGVGGKEGAFLLTSFWMVEAIALTGDLKEARAALSRLIAMLSPLGLYAEEIHPEENLAIGNFPQGFSHLGLVNAIFKLEALKRRDEGWSDNEVHTPKTV